MELGGDHEGDSEGYRRNHDFKNNCQNGQMDDFNKNEIHDPTHDNVHLHIPRCPDFSTAAGNAKVDHQPTVKSSDTTESGDVKHSHERRHHRIKSNQPVKSKASNNHKNDIRSSFYAGLRNLGATCYMNSLLQSLYMNPDFRSQLSKVDFGNAAETLDVSNTVYPQLLRSQKQDSMSPQSACISQSPSDRTDKHRLADESHHDPTRNHSPDPLNIPSNIVSRKALVTILQELFVRLQFGNKSSEDPSELAEALRIGTANQEDAAEFATLLLMSLEKELGGTKFNFIPKLFQGYSSHSVTCELCLKESQRREAFYELRVQLQKEPSDNIEDTESKQVKQSSPKLSSDSSYLLTNNSTSCSARSARAQRRDILKSVARNPSDEMSSSESVTGICKDVTDAISGHVIDKYSIDSSNIIEMDKSAEHEATIDDHSSDDYDLQRGKTAHVDDSSNITKPIPNNDPINSESDTCIVDISLTPPPFDVAPPFRESQRSDCVLDEVRLASVDSVCRSSFSVCGTSDSNGSNVECEFNNLEEKDKSGLTDPVQQSDLLSGLHNEECLPEIGNATKNNSNRSLNNRSSMDTVCADRGVFYLEEGLSAMFKEEHLRNQNKYFCEHCNCKVNARKQLKISSLPLYLNFCIERYFYDPMANTRNKLATVVDFPAIFSCQSFCTKECSTIESLEQTCDSKSAIDNVRNDERFADIEDDLNQHHMKLSDNDPCHFEYELIGILEHQGPLAVSGHYTACLRDLQHPNYSSNSQPLISSENIDTSDKENHLRLSDLKSKNDCLIHGFWSRMTRVCPEKSHNQSARNVVTRKKDTLYSNWATSSDEIMSDSGGDEDFNLLENTKRKRGKKSVYKSRPNQKKKTIKSDEIEQSANSVIKSNVTKSEICEDNSEVKEQSEEQSQKGNIKEIKPPTDLSNDQRVRRQRKRETDEDISTTSSSRISETNTEVVSTDSHGRPKRLKNSTTTHTPVKSMANHAADMTSKRKNTKVAQTCANKVSAAKSDISEERKRRKVTKVTAQGSEDATKSDGTKKHPKEEKPKKAVESKSVRYGPSRALGNPRLRQNPMPVIHGAFNGPYLLPEYYPFNPYQSVRVSTPGLVDYMDPRWNPWYWQQMSYQAMPTNSQNVPSETTVAPQEDGSNSEILDSVLHEGTENVRAPYTPSQPNVTSKFPYSALRVPPPSYPCLRPWTTWNMHYASANWNKMAQASTFYQSGSSEGATQSDQDTTSVDSSSVCQSIDSDSNVLAVSNQWSSGGGLKGGQFPDDDKETCSLCSKGTDNNSHCTCVECKRETSSTPASVTVPHDNSFKEFDISHRTQSLSSQTSHEQRKDQLSTINNFQSPTISPASLACRIGETDLSNPSHTVSDNMSTKEHFYIDGTYYLGAVSKPEVMQSCSNVYKEERSDQGGDVYAQHEDVPPDKSEAHNFSECPEDTSDLDGNKSSTFSSADRNHVEICNSLSSDPVVDNTPKLSKYHLRELSRTRNVSSQVDSVSNNEVVPDVNESLKHIKRWEWVKFDDGAVTEWTPIGYGIMQDKFPDNFHEIADKNDPPFTSVDKSFVLSSTLAQSVQLCQVSDCSCPRMRSHTAYLLLYKRRKWVPQTPDKIPPCYQSVYHSENKIKTEKQTNTMEQCTQSPHS